MNLENPAGARIRSEYMHFDLTDKIIGTDSAHEAQLLHYLRATEVEIGLLLNFGPRSQVRRLVFGNERKKISANQRKSAASGLCGSNENV
ncbi:MAG TPA: GxxExxY protein [Candidatus Saccharimonadales bacterium]|jgi:hypothetical protein|nr:GxxExxY protein [Candidatus Saccharimonadales bacterium]